MRVIMIFLLTIITYNCCFSQEVKKHLLINIEEKDYQFYRERGNTKLIGAVIVGIASGITIGVATNNMNESLRKYGMYDSYSYNTAMITGGGLGLVSIALFVGAGIDYAFAGNYYVIPRIESSNGKNVYGLSCLIKIK